MDTLNRSAIVVKPKQPFLDWLHAADPTSHEITSLDVCREPTIYLIPECDTDEELAVRGGSISIMLRRERDNKLCR